MLVPDMVLLLRMRIMYRYSDTKDRRACFGSVTELKEENLEKTGKQSQSVRVNTSVSVSGLGSICRHVTRVCWRKHAWFGERIPDKKLKNRTPLSLVDLQDCFQNIQTCKHSSFLCLTAQCLHMPGTNPPRCFNCSL